MQNDSCVQNPENIFSPCQDDELSSIGLKNVGSFFYLVSAGIVASVALFALERASNGVGLQRRLYKPRRAQSSVRH